MDRKRPRHGGLQLSWRTREEDGVMRWGSLRSRRERLGREAWRLEVRASEGSSYTPTMGAEGRALGR